MPTSTSAPATEAQAQRIAERMRYYRRLQGRSQEDMARALGVTVRTYARWERGETTGHLSRLGDIAEVLETPTDELGGQLPEPAPEPVGTPGIEAKLDRIIELLEGLYGAVGARAALEQALDDNGSPGA